MTLNQFDTISALYDPLVKLFFGKAHIKSQKVFLNEMPNASNVLILGGGAGDILIELLKVKPSCKIFYIEASEKMISLAKKKTGSVTNIHFIHGTEDNIPNQIFDLVITNFYLDLFAADTLQSVVNKIQKSLQPNSHWIITEFVDDGKWWQRVMLKMMYLFFKITCKIEANHLPVWDVALRYAGFKKEKETSFFYGFIKSELYCRSK